MIGSGESRRDGLFRMTFFDMTFFNMMLST